MKNINCFNQSPPIAFAWVGSLLCTLVYHDTADRWTKTLITFLGVLVIGSVVDKIFFSVTTYVYSDFLLIIVALALSTIIYKRHGR